DNEDAENDVIQDEVDHTHQNVQGPAGLFNAEGHIVQQKVDETVGANGAAAQHIEHDHAGASQDGMHHEQDRSNEKEAELNRLGDAGDERGRRSGDQDGLDLAAVLGAGSVVHGQARADQAEHLGNAAGVPNHRLAQNGDRGVGDLSIVNVAGAFVDLTAHFGDAAQGSVQERSVDQMVQAGGNEQTL